MCICMCVCVFMCVYACGGQKLTSGVSLYGSPLYFLRWVSHRIWGLWIQFDLLANELSKSAQFQASHHLRLAPELLTHTTLPH